MLERFVVDGKQPRSVTVVTVEEAFFHCARALIRSQLWDPAIQIERSELPSMGTIMAAHTQGLVISASMTPPCLRGYPATFTRR